MHKAYFINSCCLIVLHNFNKTHLKWHSLSKWFKILHSNGFCKTSYGKWKKNITLKIQLTNLNLILFIFMLNSVIYLHGLVSNSYLILQPLLCINELSSLKFLYTTKNIILTIKHTKFKNNWSSKIYNQHNSTFFPMHFLPDFHQETEYIFLKDRILSKIQLVFALFFICTILIFVSIMLNWFFIWRHNNLFNQCLNVAYKNLLGK